MWCRFCHAPPQDRGSRNPSTPLSRPRQKSAPSTARTRFHPIQSCRNVERFRGGLAFKANRLVYHSTCIVISELIRSWGFAGRCISEFPSGGVSLPIRRPMVCNPHTEPQVPNLKPQTPTPKPQTSDPNPQTPNPESQSSNSTYFWG